MGNPGTAFEDIARDLTELDFVLIEDVCDEKAFGSRYAHYQRGDENLRLSWDAKEEWLVLEGRHENERGWKELCIEEIGRKTADSANIAALRSALQRQVNN